MTNELTREDIGLLLFLRAKYHNRTKQLIRDAWYDGDYSPLGIALGSNEESILQFLRNSKGPSWLAGLKWKELGQPVVTLTIN